MDAARAPLGSDAPTPAQGAPAGGAPPVPELSLEQKAAGLVALCEVVQVTTLSIVVKGAGVDITKEQFDELAKYSRDDKAMLLTLAPHAVPYVDLLLTKYPWLPAGGFVLAASLNLATRIKRATNEFPKKAPPAKKPAPAPAAAAA